MSEQIVSEASAWQGAIEGDYRESAQNFAPARSKCSFADVQICIRQAFGKVAQKLTNI